MTAETRASATVELPAEHRALLACARAVIDPTRAPELRGALAACPSTETLCGIAARHGMIALLRRAVAGGGDVPGPPGLEDRLDVLQRILTVRCLRQTSQLLQLLGMLANAGVVAMPIKGPAWAQRQYGEVTLRAWVDLDLMVRFSDAARARAVLLDSGFWGHSPFAERLLQRPTRTEGELQFTSAQGDLLVDLQWQMGVGHSASALSGEDLLARAQRLSLLGREVLTPTDTDMLLMTCLHGTRHRWDSIELLLGLAVQVQGISETAWPGVLAAARRVGCARRLTIAVAHVCRVLGAQLPATVSDRLDHDPLARAFVRSLTPDTLLGGSPTGRRREHFASLLWTLAMEDTVAENLAHVAVRVMRPGPHDWEAWDLPTSLEWPYYPLRPFRLFLRLARMKPGRGHRMKPRGADSSPC